MTIQNLWGELPDPENVRTPEQIIKEQASELTRLTNGKIIGFVNPLGTSKKNQFSYALGIRVPTLNNYQVRIVMISHELGFYPTDIVSQLHSDTTYDVVAGNEKEFNTALEAILKSKEARDILSSLLTHVKSL